MFSSCDETSHSENVVARSGISEYDKIFYRIKLIVLNTAVFDQLIELILLFSLLTNSVKLF